MSIYEFVIKDKNGNTIQSLDSAMNRSFELYLNKAGAASFVVSPKDTKITQDLLLLGHKELFIYRNGVLVWGGELVYRRADVDGEREGVVITAKGFFDLLSKKIVGSAANPRLFTNTDLSTIAWTIINEAQTGTNASFGITQGSLATSRPADRTYEYKVLKEAIEGLSNTNVQNGIDFEIDAQKQFSTFYPQKGRQLVDISFEWGVNILSFSEVQDASEMANQVIVLGEGEGSEMITVTRDSQISGIQSTYKIRQKTISHKDANKTSTLNDWGDKELSLRQAQQQIISIKTRGDLEPSLGSYVVGDSVRVKIKYGIVDVDTYFRIYGIKVKISDEDLEDIEIVFNPS